jgi:hypothetical protein
MSDDCGCYTNYEHERAELGEAMASSPAWAVSLGDTWYDWSNPEDRPAMRAALGRFAPDCKCRYPLYETASDCPQHGHSPEDHS